MGASVVVILAGLGEHPGDSGSHREYVNDDEHTSGNDGEGFAIIANGHHQVREIVYLSLTFFDVVCRIVFYFTS